MKIKVQAYVSTLQGFYVSPHGCKNASAHTFAFKNFGHTK